MSEISALPSVSAVSARPARVQSVDLVRGLVMVIMALDHVREFWSPTPVRPEDVGQASALLFFTRWITHFCAPTFVFLAGVSIFLYQQKKVRRAAVSWFLLTRGLWLVILEMLVVSFLLVWGYQLVLLQVIWATGWGMILLAGLLWLPRWLLGTLALGFLAVHNLLPPIDPVTAANLLGAVLHNGPFMVPPTGGAPAFLVAYSIGPWAAVLAAGYWLGPWFVLPLEQRNQLLRRAGAALLLLFGVLRLSNWYGDPGLWSGQPRGGLYTALSFLNVTKYPPSLLFLCLTLGAALLLLSWTETAAGRGAEMLRTYGRVPFFYYLLHLLLISAGALLWTTLAFGQPVNFGFIDRKDWPAAYQPNLLRAYVVWLSVVAVLYLPCRWYQGYKQRHSYWWLSYL